MKPIGKSAKAYLLEAQRQGYAIPAFNIHNLETLQVIGEVAEELSAPVMVAATPGTVSAVGAEMLLAMGTTLDALTRAPLILHLDHGKEVAVLKRCLEKGYRSLMIDASEHPFEENIEITQNIVMSAHAVGASVEAELGLLKGIEDDLSIDAEVLTDPDMAETFVKRTGVDALAVAIGTAHGFYKATPKIDLERLEAIRSRVAVPLVLHGASGLSNEVVKACIQRGVCKVNVATELKYAFAHGLRRYLAEYPEATDPRQYFQYAKEDMAEVVRHKIQLCGCAGKA